MQLKAQDTIIALKYLSLNISELQMSVRDIAESIAISASEVSKGTQRLIRSQLLIERDSRIHPVKESLLEWLSYGVRYAYPIESIGYGRGMPTSWNCPLLNSEMSPPSPPLVWPVVGGEAEGIMIKPIHDAVPIAVSHDEDLYRIFSLIDVIRGGKPRELAYGRDMLAKFIKGN